jgi:glutamate racemase
MRLFISCIVLFFLYSSYMKDWKKLCIWFFDSGLGWKRVMEDFKKSFPEIDMILEMDRENAPYGNRRGHEIRELTKIWVQKLFDRWADVVILACNTASVHALRWLQQEVYIWKHILGVTVPGAEAVVEWGYKRIWVLATEATVKTRMYKERVHILDDSIIVEEVSAPWLVPLIEKGIFSSEEIDDLLLIYLRNFSPDIEALVLGCTHYPLVQESIERIWKKLHNNKSLDIIDPGIEAARKFSEWLRRKWF